jgi:hypothetical protein
VDRQDGIADVIGLEKKRLELGILQSFAKNGQALLKFPVDVLPFPGQLEQHLELFLFLMEAG